MVGGRSKAVRNIENVPLEAPMAIPCHKGHTHVWPTEGPITVKDVGRCQVYCQFCSTNITSPMRVEAKWGWYLRRHVYQVHRKEFPNLIVPEEWSGSKKTSKGKVGPKKGETTKTSKKSTKKTAKKTAEAASAMLTTPNLPADEFALGTYTTNATATVSDNFLFDELLALESDPTMPALPTTLDWDDPFATGGFGNPTCADPFVQGALDEALCPAAALAGLFTFEDFFNA